MPRINPALIPRMVQGDPLLGALGTVAGSAIGGSIGGPAGAAIGGSLGGQLGGQGTIDLEKTAIDTAQGAAMGSITSALGTAVDDVAAGIKYDINPMSEQARMLAEQDKEFGMFFSTGGQIPPPQQGWSSLISEGQGLQQGIVDDAAMELAYSPMIMQLTSPIGAMLSSLYVGNKMDKIGAASNTLSSNPLTISDKSGNVRPVDEGQMSAYNALASNDPFSGGFGNQKEAISAMKHGFGSDEHFNQINEQVKEVKTGSNNTSGDNYTNMVRGRSGSPILNARTGAPIANANQPSVDSTGDSGSPAGGK